jgi:hypothetical protein
VVLGPRRQPKLGPPQSTRDHQPTLSKLLNGVLPETRPDARRAVVQKLAQHGFSAAVRLGVEAPTAERRRTLLVGLAAAIGTAESTRRSFETEARKADRVDTPRASWSALVPHNH